MLILCLRCWPTIFLIDVDKQYSLSMLTNNIPYRCWQTIFLIDVDKQYSLQSITINRKKVQTNDRNWNGVKQKLILIKIEMDWIKLIQTTEIKIEMDWNRNQNWSKRSNWKLNKIKIYIRIKIEQIIDVKIQIDPNDRIENWIK